MQVQESLYSLLQHPDMIAEVKKQIKCETAEFLGHVFQPLPYSLETRSGMPKEFEPFHNNPEVVVVMVVVVVCVCVCIDMNVR